MILYSTASRLKKKEVGEYLRRIEAVYIKVKELVLSHLVVCGGREHFKNIILSIKG